MTGKPAAPRAPAVATADRPAEPGPAPSAPGVGQLAVPPSPSRMMLPPRPADALDELEATGHLRAGALAVWPGMLFPNSRGYQSSEQTRFINLRHTNALPCSIPSQFPAGRHRPPPPASGCLRFAAAPPAPPMTSPPPTPPSLPRNRRVRGRRRRGARFGSVIARAGGRADVRAGGRTGAVQVDIYAAARVRVGEKNEGGEKRGEIDGREGGR